MVLSWFATGILVSDCVIKGLSGVCREAAEHVGQSRSDLVIVIRWKRLIQAVINREKNLH
jgi:hypothetical protein